MACGLARVHLLVCGGRGYAAAVVPPDKIIQTNEREVCFLSRGTVYNGPWENPSRSGEA